MDNSKEGNGSSPPPPPPIDLEPTSTYDTVVLEYISEMLMEEEEEELGNNIPFTLHEVLALRATEKSLHDSLHNINLDTSCGKSLDSNYDSLHHPSPSSSGVEKNTYNTVLLQYISEMLMEEEEEEEELGNMLHDSLALQATEKSLHDALHNIILDSTCRRSDSKSPIGSKEMVSESSGAKKTRSREDSDLSEHQRSNKQSANNNADDNESELLQMYENVLLSSKLDSIVQTYGQTYKGQPRTGHRFKNKNIIDVRSLLMQCAQAVENYDNRTLFDLLSQIRQHSSPKGDDTERLAHYFASALEARLSGTGTISYASLNSDRISTAEILNAYKIYVIACPFKQMSNILANWTIGDVAKANKATTIHIIDFGILYGLQWPCLIHGLSEISGRPLIFRITAIDFPQPGFRPAARVVDTCRRLAKLAQRLGVPFQYSVIAQRWDTIEVEDLGIVKNEPLVVNCMYRFHNVPDETETGESSRDAVLDLIRKINPDLFVHGVANGTHNTPFFVPRFREALFHYASMFDMFNATMPQDDEDRQLYEKHFFGKEVMNIIACEGTERVERPEKYKQWERRTVRAGFRQVRIHQRIVEKLKKVRTGYHKSFSVDEEGKWVLLGWKGRVVQGFSCWRPTHNPSSS